MSERLMEEYYGARDTSVGPEGSPEWAEHWRRALQEKRGAIVLPEEETGSVEPENENG